MILWPGHNPTEDPIFFEKLLCHSAFPDVSVQTRVIKCDDLLGSLGIFQVGVIVRIVNRSRMGMAARVPMSVVTTH